MSFVLVVVFSAVFVASGVEVLADQQKVPDGNNFLGLQARFVTGIHQWLLPIYVGGAYLTIFGTLYGTLEIGTAVCREIVRAMSPDFERRNHVRLKKFTVIWCVSGALLVLIWSFIYTLTGRETIKLTWSGKEAAKIQSWQIEEGDGVGGGDVAVVVENSSGMREVSVPEPGVVKEILIPTGGEIQPNAPLAILTVKTKARMLITILTPANNFTGVFACGLLCFLMPWIDRRFLPNSLRMHWSLVILNFVSGAIFLGLGIKWYWENHNPQEYFLKTRWLGIGTIIGMAVLSIVLAYLRESRVTANSNSDNS